VANKKGGVGGRVRSRTDIGSESVQKLLTSLDNLSKDAHSENIVAVLCNLTSADIKQTVPGDVIERATRCVEVIHKMHDGIMWERQMGINSIESAEIRLLDTPDNVTKLETKNDSESQEDAQGNTGEGEAKPSESGRT